MLYSKNLLLAMLKSIAFKTGLDLKRTVSQSTLESHLHFAIKLYDIDLVIDVGANQGQFGQLLRIIGYKGRILSFEPLFSAFDTLRKEAQRDRNWTAVNLALGSKSGTLEINEYESSEFSSALTPTTFADERFGLSRSIRGKHFTPMETLDRYLEQHPERAKRIFLKMDTQGYDLNVFAGAMNTMSRIFLLQSEISFQPVYDGIPDYKTSLLKFTNSGYFVTGIFPVSRGKDLSMIEADVVVARSFEDEE